MPNCDTLHALIKDYRDARKVLLNIEHRSGCHRPFALLTFSLSAVPSIVRCADCGCMCRVVCCVRRLMLQMAPDYQGMTLMQKVRLTTPQMTSQLFS